MIEDIQRRLAGGPGHFPHSLDFPGDRLLLLEMSEAALGEASFLDQRVLTAEARGAWVPMADALALVDPAMRDDAHYIFHIGHVGSTLVSRLLGRIAGVLSLREPQSLRQLTEVMTKRGDVDAPWDPATLPARVALLRRLLARTFRPDQRTIVKATSFVSEIAPALVAPQARALFLHVSPESYMRTILAGEASLQELAMLTGPRLARLARRIDPMPHRLWTLGLGQRVALGWVTEMLSLAAAAQALPQGAVLWLDFDRFLADPAAALAQMAVHFGLPLDPAAAAQLAADPLMTRYSKAPEHGYSADLRRQLQAQAGQEHGAALREGMGWIEDIARAHPAVARLLH